MRENMGPLSPLSRKPLGILKFFKTQKVIKNYELSNDKKYSYLSYLIFYRVQFQQPFPDNILAKDSRKNNRIPRFSSLANPTPF